MREDTEHQTLQFRWPDCWTHRIAPSQAPTHTADAIDVRRFPVDWYRYAIIFEKPSSRDLSATAGSQNDQAGSGRFVLRKSQQINYRRHHQNDDSNVET